MQKATKRTCCQGFSCSKAQARTCLLHPLRLLLPWELPVPHPMNHNEEIFVRQPQERLLPDTNDILQVADMSYGPDIAHQPGIAYQPSVNHQPNRHLPTINSAFRAQRAPRADRARQVRTASRKGFIADYVRLVSHADAENRGVMI